MLDHGDGDADRSSKSKAGKSKKSQKKTELEDLKKEIELVRVAFLLFQYSLYFTCNLSSSVFLIVYNLFNRIGIPYLSKNATGGLKQILIR